MSFARTIGIEPGLRLGLVAEGGRLVEIRFGEAAGEDGGHALLDEAERQLRAYFEGRLREFDLPMKTSGTAFQESVWRMVAAIGYGRMRT